ncbi:Holliday junction branch migration protein RuvA [Candidatus Omnitrophota bacterium]
MIARIKGKLLKKDKGMLLIDVNNVCYEVVIPPTVMSRIEETVDPEGSISLVTYHYYQAEPSKSTPVLIGFANEVEKEFFEQFITVSGIGPRAAARAINRPISEIVAAIDNADNALLRSLPGIGPQRAREIIAKLQGRVGKFGLIKDAQSSPARPAASDDVQNEVIQLLHQLQYKNHEAKEMVHKALERNPGANSAEELINEIYKQRLHKKP